MYIPMSIKATFTSLSVGLTRAESSQLSLQLCPSSDKSKAERKQKCVLKVNVNEVFPDQDEINYYLQDRHM